MARRKSEGFEEHLKELERIVESLEAGDLTLDQSLERYQEGVERLKACHALLREAEGKVKLLLKDAEGGLREADFESEEA